MADFTVSVPAMLAYWLQAGRIDAGFLGATQIDRGDNLNTRPTVLDRITTDAATHTGIASSREHELPYAADAVTLST